MDAEQARFLRYQRQMAYAPFGLDAQRALSQSIALIVGVGGLGSWAAELLARAGAGALRLVDDDAVADHNLHRQAMYDERDAGASTPKVLAAAAHLARINSSVAVEPVTLRLTPDNIDSLALGADVIVDGTDNFATRFLINDYAVKHARPWVFAGVIGAEGQVMAVVPGRTACLRCLYDSPPPPCVEPTCRTAGVLGPAVAAVASLEAQLALKLLSGRAEQVSPQLLKLDLWGDRVQRVHVGPDAVDPDCLCCGHRSFEFLEP